MMKGVDVMSYAKGISRKDKKKYLKDVQKNLRLLYSQENVNDIVKIMNSSIDDFIQNNPLSTLNDFKTYVNTEDIFSDWIQNAECDEIITKIDINSTRKKDNSDPDGDCCNFYSFTNDFFNRPFDYVYYSAECCNYCYKLSLNK